MTSLISSSPSEKAESAFLGGRLDEARKVYFRDSCLNPQSPFLFQNAGVVSANLGDWQSASRFFNIAAKLQPDSPLGFLELGKVQFIREDFADAVRNLQASVALDPGAGVTLVHLSRALRRQRRFEESASIVRRAHSVDRRDSEALREIGDCLRELGHYFASIDALGRAAALDPSNPGTLLTLAYCELHVGNYVRGWCLYEYRWMDKEFLKYHRDSALQRWKGQPSIKGRRLIVFSEQGFGDTIQFARFLQGLAGFGAEVTLLVPPALERLFESLPWVSRVTARVPGDTFAACCSLMSLPSILRITLNSIPFADTAYLSSRPELVEIWRERLGPSSSPRIGVCWSASENPMSANRSIPLKQFSSLFLLGLQIVSLQKTIPLADVDQFEEARDSMTHFGDELVDFTATAGLIDLMDLVITVDTSVAHLAGAMGKEVWVLLPARADWRWLSDRSDSPWYSGARLFRQNVDGDWQTLIEEVVTALRRRYKLDAWVDRSPPVIEA